MFVSASWVSGAFASGVCSKQARHSVPGKTLKFVTSVPQVVQFIVLVAFFVAANPQARLDVIDLTIMAGATRVSEFFELSETSLFSFGLFFREVAVTLEQHLHE